ncbi:uncharacterized protein K02A2.6-like [Dermacentor silvarum]|uniref:uncharacterized protein K02A2.6-like n=1 Tax=Dermacentor silvarum TaxID=543639 RepID=UPI0021015D34|nr:uncharacterized protein K02A2.6-like [Dermacentor silvarum]
MTIDGVLVNMELDTGAAVSVMSKTQFRQLFPSAVLEPTKVKLRTYTGALVRPQGVSSVNMQQGDHSAILPLYVVDHKGPPLLGWEWLHAVRLEWAKIWNLNNITRSDTPTDSVKKRLDALLAKYQPLFKDELGTITEERAELFLKPDTKPRFLKARNVPFVLQKAFDAELAKMEQLGIISPVTTSEYATPAVPVIKQDGSIRICGDYKTTVNPCLEVDRYPLPKVDDLFTALSGGKHFSKIDLNRAYQQDLRYLGHRISTQGISATTEKVDALLKAPAPKDRKQLQSFLRVVNFYGKFLPNLATVAQPFFRRNELTVQQGCIMFGMRVIVPAKLRDLLLDELHEVHPGIVRSKQLARSYVWWPSIEADLEHRVKACWE